MHSTGIHGAVLEYAARYEQGDRRALHEFETEYGRSLKRIVARVARSRRPRSRFEQVILLHLQRMSQTDALHIDRDLVQRLCEAILVSSSRERWIRV